ncbi:MFS transporter [Mucilaginibacter sp. Bleaf8]|uniref:MFS transporter n=1 Tax=Mucilaginibacter sp. Bleaf8 TaxID=2834430 RepID=UPI001BCCA378|nr:MFS transporter [Mucilaginibacter sp. Bleaf8]MBS7563454.1 MFS transporter [Mucilaginibacter sp. Bleaf8]
MAALSDTFRSLKYHNFRLYFTGQSISLIGTWMERISVNWLVYTTTHSALMLGVVNFAGQIPTLLLSPYGGAISDRHNRYRVLLTTQIAAMIQASIMAVLVLTHTYNLAAIISLNVVLGIINAFDTPSRQSLMIRLIEDKKDLQNAIALNSSMVNLARLLGPAVAGVLLTTVGTGICFLLNALSFIAVIISLLLMKLPPIDVKKSAESVWQNLQQGYSYLQQNSNLKLMILLMASTSFFVMPFTTLMPVFAKDVFKGNAATYSALNSISGLGSLIGAIYMAGFKTTKNIRKVTVYACGLFGLGIAVFAWCANFWLALVFIMIAGAGTMMQIAGTNTYIQTNVRDDMRGRVISYYAMAFLGMQPLGSFLAGLGAHHISPRMILFIEGLAGVVTAVLFAILFKRDAAKQIEGTGVGRVMSEDGKRMEIGE